MKKWCAAFALVGTLAYSHAATAAEFRFDPIRLVVPDDFSGPIRAAPDSHSETVAFSRSSEPGTSATVLQLTRFDFEQPLPSNSEVESFETASKYLLDMLRGIERTRTSYTQALPEKVLLDGKVGARSAWKGELRGVPVNGVMYAIVIGNRVIFLHAFGTGDTPDAQLLFAIQAIEALRHEV